MNPTGFYNHHYHQQEQRGLGSAKGLFHLQGLKL
jgi:hypothetical protein